MTDAELAAYLGIKTNHPQWATFIASLATEKRASYERMHALEGEVVLWQAGLGPEPTDVLAESTREERHRAEAAERCRRKYPNDAAEAKE